MNPIRPRERDTVIQALRAGVVPRVGQHHIQVGRVEEIASMIRDVERIADGGSSFRLVIGDYGSGKTFFLNLTRAVALEKRLVATNADLNPDRRLHASGGQARSLFNELMKNISTRSKPEGNALESIVQRFISTARTEAEQAGTTAEVKIREKLGELQEMVGGYDFADVVAAYCRGFEESNPTLCSDAIRWMRGEFSTKTDARNALGVRTIIGDDQIYDHLKLFARFVTCAGYAGLFVCLDEMVNLFKLTHKASRDANYEQILRILNDLLQGSARHIGVLMGGTSEFLINPRRGLYSYEALQTRLAENSFAGQNGLVDRNSTVLRLESLSQEDFFVLLQNLRHVFAGGDPDKYLIPDEGLVAFMQHAASRVGAQFFLTPRTTIISFLDLLAILDQNPDADWKALVGTVEIAQDDGGEVEMATGGDEDDDDLTQLRI